MLSLFNTPPHKNIPPVFSGLPWRRKSQTSTVVSTDHENTNPIPKKTSVWQPDVKPLVRDSVRSSLVEVWAPGYYLSGDQKDDLNRLMHDIVSAPSTETIHRFNIEKNAILEEVTDTEQDKRTSARIYIDLKESQLLENLDLTGINLNDCILRTLKSPGGFHNVSLKGTILTDAKLERLNTTFITNKDQAILTGSTLPKEWREPETTDAIEPVSDALSHSKKDLSYWIPPVMMDLQHELKQQLAKLRAMLRSLSDR